MKTYDPNARCPKCAFATVSTRFIGSTSRGDVMHRQCQRCGFGWNEAPLDMQNTDRAQVDALNTAAHAGFTQFPQFPKLGAAGMNPRD